MEVGLALFEFENDGRSTFVGDVIVDRGRYLLGLIGCSCLDVVDFIAALLDHCNFQSFLKWLLLRFESGYLSLALFQHVEELTFFS